MFFIFLLNTLIDTLITFTRLGRAFHSSISFWLTDIFWRYVLLWLIKKVVLTPCIIFMNISIFNEIMLHFFKQDTFVGIIHKNKCLKPDYVYKFKTFKLFKYFACVISKSYITHNPDSSFLQYNKIVQPTSIRVSPNFTTIGEIWYN